MGHIGHSEHDDHEFYEYRLLQEHLDQTVTGAPYSPTFMKILQLLFTPEEASLARKLPLGLKSLQDISRMTKIPEKELDAKITEMAQKGLVIDMEHDGKRFAMLAPVVIGFFEFTYMRARTDLPMKELSELFEAYMKEGGKFAHSVFQGQTQIGRALVREEALPDPNAKEVLDWERASHIVKSAKVIGVSLCACRHHRSHLGIACERPQKVCLCLRAESLIRAGLAEPISNEKALEIIQQCKQQGMMQIGDNVKNRPTYICNCCGCCCGMIQSIKTFHIKNAVVSSQWIMEVALDKCKGCGKCAQSCPVNAIEIKEEVKENGQKRRWAVCDSSLCLGCGVCHSACKMGAVVLKPREKRVYTPETIFEKILVMAMERGKLAPLIFDNPNQWTYRALGKMMNVLEKFPLKAAMAIKPLRSVFLSLLLKNVPKDTGI